MICCKSILQQFNFLTVADRLKVANNNETFLKKDARQFKIPKSEKSGIYLFQLNHHLQMKVFKDMFLTVFPFFFIK